MKNFVYSVFFFFNDTATTEIYTLSLHDALPISVCSRCEHQMPRLDVGVRWRILRSEEHTSELQSLRHLVCRLLLEKKKYQSPPINHLSLPTNSNSSTSFGSSG